MKVRIMTLLLLLLTTVLNAQDQTALQYANRLDSTRMKTTLTRLTSAEFAGRKSDKKGARLTADYLAEQLKKNSIKEGYNGSYKQSIEAFTKYKSNKHFNLSNFNYTDCYSYSNSAFQDSVISGSDIIFAGYGVYHSTFNDFANIDIKGKIVMVLDGEGPTSKYGVKCHNASEMPNLKYIASQKPKAILMVSNGFNTFSHYSNESLNFYSTEESQTLASVRINELLANKILEPANKTIKQLEYESESSCSISSFEFSNTLSFKGNNSYKLADANNIVAIIEGSDLKNEYVVLSAHYDHLGMNYRGEIYPGADDNASGVAAVMEIARILNEAKKAGKGPRRSVVILFPTAEEDGLYGSKYYVEKPAYPLEKTIACVNIDMIGRIGSKFDTEEFAKGYVIALTGNSKVNEPLFGIPDSINAISTKLSLISTDGSSYSDFFSRSDHFNFHKKNIPSILFTNGTHDDLHKSTDMVDKINVGAMLQRSKLVFLTLWELANNQNPFKSLPIINKDVMD
ncbi:M28 family peptidase [Williamwhitmania taraxaci]|uniref:Peptidase family M28 n=1 Tax=Williamwhitmania taraxaci TaxID=1640674 RepID=A0A1G6H8A1_9BACT|nr:M28 family peptidase [Williamwhitmania taraxaci]SDB90482.1 Peptidase family M28 [Williamwhitmania taraxaci]